MASIQMIEYLLETKILYLSDYEANSWTPIPITKTISIPLALLMLAVKNCKRIRIESPDIFQVVNYGKFDYQEDHGSLSDEIEIKKRTHQIMDSVMGASDSWTVKFYSDMGSNNPTIIVKSEEK